MENMFGMMTAPEAKVGQGIRMDWPGELRRGSAG
jgi:hypothetical protein